MMCALGVYGLVYNTRVESRLKIPGRPRCTRRFVKFQCIINNGKYVITEPRHGDDCVLAGSSACTRLPSLDEAPDPVRERVLLMAE